jgi:hypothetical protein
LAVATPEKRAFPGFLDQAPVKPASEGTPGIFALPANVRRRHMSAATGIKLPGGNVING